MNIVYQEYIIILNKNKYSIRASIVKYNTNKEARFASSRVIEIKFISKHQRHPIKVYNPTNI